MIFLDINFRSVRVAVLMSVLVGGGSCYTGIPDAYDHRTVLEAASDCEDIIEVLRELDRPEGLTYLSNHPLVAYSGISPDEQSIWFIHRDGGGVIFADAMDEKMLGAGQGAVIIATSDGSNQTGLPDSIYGPAEDSPYGMLQSWGYLEEFDHIPQTAEFVYFHGHSPTTEIIWHPKGAPQATRKVKTAVLQTRRTEKQLSAFIAENPEYADMWKLQEIWHIAPIDKTFDNFFGITSLFIRDRWQGHFMNAPVVYFSACSQLSSELDPEASLATAMLEKGAAAVIGWDDLTSFDAIGNTDEKLMEYLLVDGMTVNQALSQTPHGGYGECRFIDYCWNSSNLVSLPASSGARIAPGGGTGCPSGNGMYCGDPNEGQDPGALYECVDGVYCDEQVCAENCVVASPGQNDYCGGCENAPAPWLPYPAGTSMGITQGPGCGGHNGSLQYAYDFNVGGTYETDNDLVAVAASNGTVSDIYDGNGYNGGWGNCVILLVDNSCVYERYCHLDVGPGSIFVEEGQQVCHGTPLGRIGTTGNSSGPHLHWQRELVAGISIPVEEFIETSIPSGCNSCTTYTNTSGCYVSENTQPAGECGGGDVDPCTGLLSGDYCGSNSQLNGYDGAPSDLVTCQSNMIVNVAPCSDGCVESPPGEDDFCANGAACPSGNGMYCGDSNLAQDPDTLYQCIDGLYSVSTVCADGCVVAPPGQNDYCANSDCDCNTGMCCDGCHYRSSNYVCQVNAEHTYGCLGNGCGSDVSIQYRDQLCSGFASICDGNFGSWGPQQVADACTSEESCSPGEPLCSADQMCVSCTDSFTVTQYECQAFSAADGGGPGGGEIMRVCASTDPQTGSMTVKARKYDGTTFGNRPYQVRVSGPGEQPCGPDSWFFVVSDSDPMGIGTNELTFTFQSIWLPDQWEKHYCITASTQPGDIGYDANNQLQQSWWHSDKATLIRQCN